MTASQTTITRGLTLKSALCLASLSILVLALPTTAEAKRIWVPLPVQKSAALSDAIGTADTDRGATLFGQCRTCHAVGSATDHGIGPNLNGILGRRAASVSGYTYSEDMANAGREGLVWTRGFLNAYLRNPSQFLEQTKMAFAGIKDETDLEDLVAYLATLKGPERPVFEASSETGPANTDALQAQDKPPENARP